MQKQVEAKNKYKGARLVIYGIYGLMLLWLVISIVVSLTINISETFKRYERVPSEELIVISDKTSAKKCFKSLQDFNNSLETNMKRYAKRFKSNPERAFKIWKKWSDGWQDDMHKFKTIYLFDSNSKIPDNIDMVLFKKLKKICTDLEMQQYIISKAIKNISNQIEIKHNKTLDEINNFKTLLITN